MVVVVVVAAAVQSVVRVVGRGVVAVAAEGGRGEGVQTGQTHPRQESRPAVGWVLWVLHHRDA